MPTPLNLTFRASPLPTPFTGTPQEFADALVARLTAENPSSIGFFVQGDTAPTSNVGPWLKDGVTWYVWSDAYGQYVPEVFTDSQFRYIASSIAPSPILYTFWIKLDSAGKATSIQYYFNGAWKDVYEDSLAAFKKRYPAQARLSGAQTVNADAASHQLLFNTIYLDPNSAYDAANSKYIVPVDGVYRVSSNIQVNNGTATAASMNITESIIVNGVLPGVGSSGSSVPSPNHDLWFISVNTLLQLNAGATISAYIFVDDSVNTGNVIIDVNSWLSVDLVQST